REASQHGDPSSHQHARPTGRASPNQAPTYEDARYMARSGEAGFLSQVSDVWVKLVFSIQVAVLDVSLRELCCCGEVFDRGAVCGGGGSQTTWGGRCGGE